MGAAPYNEWRFSSLCKLTGCFKVKQLVAKD